MTEDLLHELRAAVLHEQIKLREADKDYRPGDFLTAIHAAMKSRLELFQRAREEEPMRFEHPSHVAIWLADQMSKGK